MRVDDRLLTIYALAAFLDLRHTDRPIDYAGYTATELLNFLPVRLPTHLTGISP